MDDFPDLLEKDFGFKPPKKSTPMASNRSKSGRNSTSIGNFVFEDQKTKESGGLDYDDVFGAPPKYRNSSNGRSSTPLTSFDSMFQEGVNDYSVKSSTLPVYDKPVYDSEDMFDGLPGLRNSSSVKFENVFASAPNESSSFDDILGKLGRMEPELSSGSTRKKWGEVDKNVSGFDELLPGFGGSSPPKNRATPGTGRPQQSRVPSTISASSVIEDPLVVLQSASVPAYASSRLFTEPLEQIDKSRQSRSRKVDDSSVQAEIFDDIDPFVSIAKSKPKPLFSSGVNNREPTGEPSIRISENVSQKEVPVDNFRESHQSFFDVPTVSSDLHKAFTQNGSHTNTSSTERDSHMDMSPKSEHNSEADDDVWLTVFEVTLTTLPTSAPPPSRPPPPRPPQVLKEVKGSSSVKSKKGKDFSSIYDSSQSYWSSQTVPDTVKRSGVSSIDELEEFAKGSSQSNAVEHGDAISHEEDAEKSAAAASAAAMKEAMDRAEAKFRHAKESRERENAAKNSEAQRERDEKVMQDVQEQDLREKLDREQDQRERDEKDREQRKIEKEREHTREVEREREKGRQAVGRATKEARERATTEARQKAERAAVERVNAGARERARERAAAEAKERADKEASEAKERTAAVAKEEAEARLRADRATVNRATAEARQRAAAAAAAASAAARGNQQKNDNDFDSFFNTSARPENTSRPKATASGSAYDDQLHNRPGPEGIQRPSPGTSSGTRKTSPTVDDLTSIFGATPSSGDFQEVGGESDERRRARLERHQRAHERVEKALAEKNERDRHTQWEQAERSRMAESLDFEIKRWSTGKEGNLRALLSTLQYVLWPECGWQPVSLTDLITSASVKKVYRKATLCIHPDKVQQKGANLQQKYIAEKVFDLLKEAWNKLNSEELY